MRHFSCISIRTRVFIYTRIYIRSSYKIIKIKEKNYLKYSNGFFSLNKHICESI
jgi:hypothetical protein